jgi:putative nucleotidyltransferase with HDIG domain
MNAFVVRHSRKVAQVAHCIATALLRSGFPLNLELVQAGALLHDLAKGQQDHAAAGASILRSMDFPRVADIVAAHTDLEFSSANLDESAIVYLADKLVRGEDLVAIEQRFQPALNRFATDPPALQAAQRRMETGKSVIRAVESRLGASLSTVVHGNPASFIPSSETPIVQEATKE